MICIKCGSEIPNGSLYCNCCGKKQTRTCSKRGVKTRGNGQGSVYKLPNGKWRAEKTLGYEIIPDTEPVKSRRIVITRSDFKRKIDALNYLPILGTELDKRQTKHGTSTSSTDKSSKTSTTLKELYDLWRPTHARSQSTMNCYASGFRVFQEYWNTPMADLDIDDLQEAMDDCQNGKRTLENAKTVLGLVYKYGIPRGYVPANISGEPNLSKFLRINANGGGHKPGLSNDELEAVRKLIGKEPYADYVYANCFLGFRPSAFLNLHVEDYNKKERAFIGGSKTDAGINRTVTISPKIQNIIDRLIGDRITGAVFFDLDTGEQMTIRKYRERFYNVLDAAGVQEISPPPHRLTPHSCRHTFATMTKRVKDAPTKDKLALIGHTDERQLMDYQDVSYDDLRAITDRLGE